MTPNQKKYEVGTMLRFIGTSSSFKNGEVYTIRKSLAYPNGYDFVGRKQEGWNITFIEEPTRFELARIDDWSKEI